MTAWLPDDTIETWKARNNIADQAEMLADIAALEADVATKAPKASPTFTGSVTAPILAGDTAVTGRLTSHYNEDYTEAIKGGSLLLRRASAAGEVLKVQNSGGAAIMSLSADGKFVIPAATAATHAAQVSAIDATTGRLAIGGVEMGNTGQRAVEGLLLNGWASTGRVVLQRVGSLVSLRTIGGGGHNLNGAAASSGTFYRPPAGFTMGLSPYNARYFMQYNSNLKVTEAAYSANGDLNLVGTFPIAHQFMLHWEWRTRDAWPTSLPGTQLTAPGTDI